MTDKLQKVWYLMCNRCGFRLPDNTAAKPQCPDCNAKLHIHDYR